MYKQVKINTQELRIGNFVEINGSYGQVQAIDEYNNIKLFGYYPICEIKPIPLTEEILLKCGFEKSRGEFSKDSFNFVITSNDYFTVYTDDEFDYKFINRLSFLHQLQNLYYCLTGQELNVKL